MRPCESSGACARRRSPSSGPPAHTLPVPDPNRRLAWVEIHKKFAIPVACLAFALVGVPLAQTLRRGGRGGSFALSLAVLLGYYLLLSSGETWAQEGRMAPAVAMWLPNVVLVGLGIARRALAAGRAARPMPRARRSPRGLPRRLAALAPARRETRARPRLGLISLCDRYVLARFLSALPLVFASAMLLAVVVDYADKLDEVARHHPTAGVIFGFYRYFVLSIAVQIAPFAVLLATLVGLGVLSKNAEDTAFKASGVSLLRLALPVFVAAGLFALLAFAVGEYVLPLAEQRQARFRNVIYGRPPDYGIRTSAERNWYLARDGSIWFREESLPSRERPARRGDLPLRAGLSPGRAGPTRAQAVWSGGHWTLQDGWTRSFRRTAPSPTDVSPRRRMPGDPPASVVATRRRPEEMRFRELERLTRHLRAGRLSDGGAGDGAAGEARPAGAPADHGAARGALRVSRRAARGARRGRRRPGPRRPDAGGLGLRHQARRGRRPAAGAGRLVAQRDLRADRRSTS